MPPFKKGAPSANPSGRPAGVAGASKRLQQMIAYATDDGKALHETLIELVFGRCKVHPELATCACKAPREGKIDRSSPSFARLWFEAFTMLVERWGGKSTLPIEITDERDPVRSALDELTPAQKARLDALLEVDDEAAVASVAAALGAAETLQ